MVKVNSLVVCLVADRRDAEKIPNMETVTVSQVVHYGACRGRSLAAVYATQAAMEDPRYEDALADLGPCVTPRAIGHARRVVPG